MEAVMQNQFTTNIASAQVARSIDALAVALRKELFKYQLPKPMDAIGLISYGDETRFGLVVNAHGVNIKGHFDHVWLSNGEGPRSLGGRFRFFVQNYEGHDAGDALYQIVFDALGNTRLGNDKHFSYSISHGAEDIKRTHQKITLDLIGVIHDGMDTIDRDV
jgi:hypothetical protein